MTEKEKASIKVSAIFILPLGIIFRVVEFIFFKLGFTREIANLAVAINAMTNGDWEGMLSGFGLSLLTAIIIILFFAYILRKIAKQSIWHVTNQILLRWFLLGAVLGLATGFSSPISNEFLRGIIIAPVIVLTAWFIFRDTRITETKELDIS
ncbi:MAG: hypothetical protein KC421_24370 [Anaerolineales bacterium]|nr:hypothetical protein [Anaerolineales bacterium]